MSQWSAQRRCESITLWDLGQRPALACFSQQGHPGPEAQDAGTALRPLAGRAWRLADATALLWLPGRPRSQHTEGPLASPVTRVGRTRPHPWEEHLGPVPGAPGQGGAAWMRLQDRDSGTACGNAGPDASRRHSSASKPRRWCSEDPTELAPG